MYLPYLTTLRWREMHDDDTSSMYDTRKSMQPARSQRKYVLVLELLTTTAVQRVRY